MSVKNRFKLNNPGSPDNHTHDCEMLRADEERLGLAREATTDSSGIGMYLGRECH